MSKPAPHSGPDTQPKIKPSDIKGIKFITQILNLLRPLHEHRADPKRNLHYDEFCAYLLLYFFTPILTSMRGLQVASGFENVQTKLGLPRFSRGSASESGAVFDPELLVPIMGQIGARLGNLEGDPRLGALERRPTPVDGTLLHGLPKMVWALWLDEEHRAAKMHLQLDLLKGVPLAATLTAGQAGETRQLRENLQPGRLYITDRGYFDYALLAAILEAQSSFLTRVHDNIAYEVERENPISEQDAKAGVLQDATVRVGSKNQKHKIDRTLRLVRIHVPDRSADPGHRPKLVDAKTKMLRTRETDHTLVLLTDQMDLDVDLIALLYQYRWQIELFFRWFKKVLQADRPLALSQNGMTIVVYCALIASMLVVLWTGQKPTKRTFELICFYFAGWISDEELLKHLGALKPAGQSKQTK